MTKDVAGFLPELSQKITEIDLEIVSGPGPVSPLMKKKTSGKNDSFRNTGRYGKRAATKR